VVVNKNDFWCFWFLVPLLCFMGRGYQRGCVFGCGFISWTSFCFWT